MTNAESWIDHNAQAPQMRGLAFDQQTHVSNSSLRATFLSNFDFETGSSQIFNPLLVAAEAVVAE